MTAKPAHGETSRVLLQSYAGKMPADGPRFANALVGTLGDQAPLHGEALASAIAARISRAPGPTSDAGQLRARVEKGRLQFIEGEYAEAIRVLGQARRAMLARQAMIANDQTLRRTLHAATLFLAHAFLRSGQKAKGIELLGEVVRSFPDRELSLVKHGPDLVAAYRKVRADVIDQDAGSLDVVTEPAGCMVYLNERYVGLSPKHLDELYPGKYRVYVQRPGETGRTHLVDVDAANHKLNVNYGLDHALHTEGATVALLYADRAQMRQAEREHALQIGRTLDAREVMLLGLRTHRGRRAIQGTVLTVATGRVVRSGLVATEPSAPTADEIRALGQFLILGKPGDGVIIGEATEAVASAGSGHSSLRWLRWVALGTGVALLGAGVTLIALDGMETDCGDGGNCASSFAGMGPGIGLTVAGGVALASSAVLFWLSADKERPPAEPTAMAAPWVSENGAGIAAHLRF